MSQNENVDFTSDELYVMIQNNDDKHKQINQEKKINNVAKQLGLIVLLIFIGFILYLTIYRYIIAGKLFNNGKSMASLAVLSPEIMTLTNMGLMI